MQLRLPYGASAMQVELPGDAVVLEPGGLPAVHDPRRLARSRLAVPQGTPPLAHLARGRMRACIALPDATRPAICGDVLSEVVAQLAGAGVGLVEVVIATGSHRAATAEEARLVAGPEAAAEVAVRSHDAFAGEHVCVGALSSGVEVWIDRAWVEADLRLAFGVVEPHLLAGYSGGAKTVCPGLARIDTIRGVHRAALARGCVGPGIVADNPFRDEIEAALALAPAHFAVQCVAGHDGGLAHVTAGSMPDSVRDATARVETAAAVAVDRTYDIVVTTAGGRPLDRTLYQAAKGWLAAQAGVRPGGDSILVAELGDGIGSEAFEALLRRVRDPQALARVLDDPAHEHRDQWMLQHVFQARARARLHVVSSLPAARLEDLGFAAHPSLDAALASLAPRASLLVLPRGPYGVLHVQDSLVTLEGVRVASGRS